VTTLVPGDLGLAGRPRASAWTARGLGVARVACVIASFVAIALPFGPPAKVFADRVGAWTHDALYQAPKALLGLRTYERARDLQLERRRAEYALPLVREQVGAGTVDQLGSAQSLLLHNDLPWHPRPVFQSYLTFTPGLARANARFLESADAPGHVLYTFETIDRRLPGSEDGLAQQVLWRDYLPVLEERGAILLRRRADAPRVEPPREVVLDRQVGLREEIDLSALPGECLILSLKFEETAFGRLRRTLFRSPVLYAECTLANADASRFRLVPGMVSGGVVVRPMPLSTGQLLDLLNGRTRRLPRLERLRVLAPPEADRCYEPMVRVRVERADALLPRGGPWPLSPAEAAPFDPAPRELLSSFVPSRFAGPTGAALLVHAPSELAFPLSAGKHRLSARCGVIAPGPGEPPTDGVVFGAVVVEPGSQPRALWYSTLEGGGSADLEREFEASGPATLYLRTGQGKARDASSDRAWWSDVRLVRVQG
jgi:hypothetical protein